MNLNKFDNVHKELNVVAELLEKIKGTWEHLTWTYLELHKMKFIKPFWCWIHFDYARKNIYKYMLKNNLVLSSIWTREQMQTSICITWTMVVYVYTHMKVGLFHNPKIH